MTTKEALLSKLEEEALELAHRISKALHFGVYEVQDGQPFTNLYRINREYNDLLATEELLRENLQKSLPCLQRDQTLIDHKKEKLLKYLDYSRSLGIIND